MNVTFHGFDTPEDRAWFLDHLCIPQTSDARGFIAVNAETNERLAAVIYDHWTPNAVQMHQVITNPMVLRHGWANAVTGYVFNETKRGVIYGFVASDNVLALRLYKHICNGELVRVPDMVREGVDGIMFYLRRENCNYCDVSQRNAA